VREIGRGGAAGGLLLGRGERVGRRDRGRPAVLKRKKKIGGREEEEWASGFNWAGRN
jgi:hypothetical protein